MSLRLRTLLYVLILGLLSGSASIYFNQKSVNDILIHQMARIGLSESEELSKKIALGIHKNNELWLLNNLQEALIAAQAGEAFILDLGGRVLAHTNVSEKGKVYSDSVTRKTLDSDSSFDQILLKNSNPTIEISAPIWNQDFHDSSEQMLMGNEKTSEGKVRLGTLRLTIPLINTINTRDQIVRRMVLIMILIGLLAVAFAFGLINNILRPVHYLTKGTTQISKGEYGGQIPVLSKDELGVLASHFNQMSRILAETTVSKNFMSSILFNMLDTLFVVDPSGNLSMCNQAACQLLGYSQDELLGKPVQILFANHINPIENLIPSTLPLNENEIKNREVNLLPKQGDPIPVLYSSSLLKNSSDQIIGLIVVARDMTEHRRLESVVRISEKMSAVGQLAAGVAHEINNPLAVILGFAQSLIRRLQPNDPNELPMKSIEQEALRCKNIVQDLLSFSRVSKTELEPLNLNNSIKSATSLINLQAKMGNITVQTNLNEELPQFLGNAGQIQQIIINLATNAIDAMKQSGTLTIQTEVNKEDGQDWVCLKVIDTGEGIPPGALNKIFEPFFTTKALGKGTGLGLSLVHEFVKKHSGRLDVQSAPGHTEFCIKFPTNTGEKGMGSNGGTKLN